MTVDSIILPAGVAMYSGEVTYQPEESVKGTSGLSWPSRCRRPHIVDQLSEIAGEGGTVTIDAQSITVTLGNERYTVPMYTGTLRTLEAERTVAAILELALAVFDQQRVIQDEEGDNDIRE